MLKTVVAVEGAVEGFFLLSRIVSRPFYFMLRTIHVYASKIFGSCVFKRLAVTPPTWPRLRHSSGFNEYEYYTAVVATQYYCTTYYYVVASSK